MEPEHSTSSIYRSVIDDVVSRVKPEFVGEGVDEAVLDELRVTWETKLLQSGALDPPPAPAPAAGSYGVTTHSYAQPSAYTHAGAGGGQLYNQATHSLGQPQAHLHHPAGVVGPAAAGRHPNPNPGGYTPALGQPAPVHPGYSAPAPPALQYGAAAQAAGGSFAAAGRVPGALKRELEDLEGWPAGAVPAKRAAYTGAIPQQDGPADDAGASGAAGAGSSAAAGEPTEARDTLSDVESDEAEEDKEYANVVVAQFEKVTRTKNRWKCTLKDGVMHLNGRDFLFNRASGEMQF